MRRLNAFQVYEKYLAIRSHFNSSSYDYFKYNAKINAGVKHFITRKDKWVFEKLSRNYEEQDLVDLIVANFTKNNNCYAMDLLEETSKLNYYDWKKKKDGVVYFFDSELQNLENYLVSNELKLIDIFKPQDNTHPIVYKLYCSGDLSLEFICILEILVGFLELQKNTYTTDILVKNFAKKIKKMQNFLLPSENQHKYTALLLKKLLMMIKKTG